MTMYVVLPPSEGKRPGGAGAWQPSADELGKAQRRVARELRTFVRSATDAERTKFFGVSGDHLVRAVTSARSGLVDTPTLPARERYSGVVWEHLDLATLPAAAQRRAANNVLVVSGLLGLVRADEPIPDYRLKMGARLGRLGPLATWWRPRLAGVARLWFAHHTVVDLLTHEHGAALDPAAFARHTVRVRFVSITGSQAAGHNAKAAKGLLARSLVAAPAKSDAVDVCAAFMGGGFAFADASTEGTVTTVRIAARAS